MQSLPSTPLVPATASPASVTAKFFRGLGDPTRIRVLQLLLERERTVTELVEETGSLQGRLSSHLTCLRWCGFVTSRREGRRVFYSLADGRIPRLLSLADEFLAAHANSVDLCRVIDAERGLDEAS
jgi:ArsR family transcriptional regulator, cadmium/lead-responsive transcriptional repressor